MATTAKNNIVRQVAPKSVFPSAINVIDATVSVNQGDLVALVSNKLKAVAIDGDTATLLGVMPVTIVSGKIQSPYSGTAVDAAQSISEVPGPVFGVVAKFTLNTGDSLNPGDKVYPLGSAGAQTVTSSSNAGARSACGIYQGAAIAGAAAGTQIEVMVGAQVTGALTF